VEGKNDSDPIILEDVSPGEFEKFLWIFYNPCVVIYFILSKDHSLYM